MKIFYFSDDSMPEIFCMKHFYIFPLAFVSRGWTPDVRTSSEKFSVNSVIVELCRQFNTKAVGFLQ